MPRLIDWGVRYELIREAVVRIAARQGAAAVTVDSVSAELKISTTTLRRTVIPLEMLAEMGVVWIDRQRGFRTYLRGRPDGSERGSVEHMAWVLLAEIPTDADHLEQERAWAQLTHVGASEHTAELLAGRHRYLDGLVRRCLEQLGTEETAREREAIHLRALVDGLTAAACRSGVTPDDAMGCLTDYLRGLRSPPSSAEAVELSPGAA